MNELLLVGVSLLITAAMAIATFYMALQASKANKLTKEVLDRQKAPNIILYVDYAAHDKLNIVIENISTNPAFDLNFECPDELFYKHETKHPTGEILTETLPCARFLYEGLTYFAPLQKRCAKWGKYTYLTEHFQHKSFTICYSYKDVTGTTYSAKAILSSNNIAGTVQSSTFEQDYLVSAIRSIADAIENQPKISCSQLNNSGDNSK